MRAATAKTDHEPRHAENGRFRSAHAHAPGKILVRVDVRLREQVPGDPGLGTANEERTLDLRALPKAVDALSHEG